MNDYQRIAAAIDYIVANAGSQPGLAEIAAAIGLSPYHFQRLFARWAGLTPKRFLEVMTVERAKQLLAGTSMPLLEASDRVGFSSSSRLHDHFVQLEAVTPGEFRREGEGITIRFGQGTSPFGRAFVATTGRGICALAFVDDDAEPDPVATLAANWPRATLVEDGSEASRQLAAVFGARRAGSAPLSVLVRGTNFQVAVWRALLAIPEGRLASYRDVATAIGKPKAVRAVGTAVGANPCAFLIPCHRVIRGSGEPGGYRWGLTRKRAINAWEAGAADGMLTGC